MAYKKLGDTKLYPHMVALITAMGKTMAEKKDPDAAAFQQRSNEWVKQYGNILNFPIVASEDETLPGWYDEFILALADKFTAKDFSKYRTLGLALSNFILCYTETIKKPKLWEELIFIDVSEAIDGFEDFVIIKEEDDDLPTPSGVVEEEEEEVSVDIDDEPEEDIDADPEDDTNDNA